PDGVCGDVSLLILGEIQRREHGRAAPIGRIALDQLVEPRAVLRGVDKRRPLVFELPFRPVEGGVVRHLRMEAHRSTSPMTTSIEPMTAITSAMRPPPTMEARAWHASSDGARDFTRHGRFVPSDTTWNPCSPRGPSTGTYASPAGTVNPCE